jgi:energy-coupling factor transporter ATP-binding protein EcfA2
MDEPLEGLDGPTYDRLLDDLPHLLATFQATSLLVTHSAEEALRLAQDLVVLIDGRVCAAGSKRDVAASPGDAAVAEVLGYMVLPCGGRRVAVPPGALALGAGACEFTVIVDDVVDLVDRMEVVGRIDAARVRVTLPPSATPPAAGVQVRVHATRYWDLT